jgi:hypothetical protein
LRVAVVFSGLDDGTVCAVQFESDPKALLPRPGRGGRLDFGVGAPRLRADAELDQYGIGRRRFDFGVIDALLPFEGNDAGIVSEELAVTIDTGDRRANVILGAL